MSEHVLNRFIQSTLKKKSNYFDSQISRNDFTQAEEQVEKFMQDTIKTNDEAQKKRMELIFGESWDLIINKYNTKDSSEAGWWNDGVNKWLRTMENKLPSSDTNIVMSVPGRFSVKR